MAIVQYSLEITNLMYYVYLLKSKQNGHLYTGSANDLKKRLAEHASGKSGHTRKYLPYDLIYYEACLNKEDARAREKYLKSGMGKRYLKNRLRRFLISNEREE